MHRLADLESLDFWLLRLLLIGQWLPLPLLPVILDDFDYRLGSRSDGHAEAELNVPLVCWVGFAAWLCVGDEYTQEAE